MADDKQWLTTSEVATLLKVQPITVWRLTKAGKLEHDRTPGGHRRYDPAVVAAYIAQIKAEQQD